MSAQVICAHIFTYISIRFAASYRDRRWSLDQLCERRNRISRPQLCPIDQWARSSGGQGESKLMKPLFINSNNWSTEIDQFKLRQSDIQQCKWRTVVIDFRKVTLRICIEYNSFRKVIMTITKVTHAKILWDNMLETKISLNISVKRKFCNYKSRPFGN